MAGEYVRNIRIYLFLKKGVLLLLVTNVAFSKVKVNCITNSGAQTIHQLGVTYYFLFVIREVIEKLSA